MNKEQRMTIGLASDQFKHLVRTHAWCRRFPNQAAEFESHARVLDGWLDGTVPWEPRGPELYEELEAFLETKPWENFTA